MLMASSYQDYLKKEVSKNKSYPYISTYLMTFLVV